MQTIVRCNNVPCISADAGYGRRYQPDLVQQPEADKIAVATSMALKAIRQPRVRQLEECSREMFGDVVVTSYFLNLTAVTRLPERPITPMSYTVDMEGVSSSGYSSTLSLTRRSSSEEYDSEKRRTSVLVDQLLADIYSFRGDTDSYATTDYSSCASHKSQKCGGFVKEDLCKKGKPGAK